MGKIEQENDGGEPEGEGGDDPDQASPRSARLKRHLKSLTFHRAIHRKLDDGALIALCENYEAEDADEPEEGSRKGDG